MRRLWIGLALVFLLPGAVAADDAPAATDEGELFRSQVAPIFEARCLGCHNDNEHKGGLSLESAAKALAASDSGKGISPGKPDESFLLDYVIGDEPQMPKDGKPLSSAEVAILRRWIETGAAWPANMTLADKALADLDWWSLQPLALPPLPRLSPDETRWARTPIDAFIVARLREQQLSPSSQADRRTLIRRVMYDLIGLPPTPEEIEQFVNDPDPQAYEHLVDRLLASPRYGEHWARHWLDVVQYADTHGYDKDKPRPHAWPYRDYVIRAFNDDKPYARFVEEQLAGDVLWPGESDGIVALGFIAAGPWDFIGHVEVPEKKIDGQVARNLDRDDMVTNTMNTFASFTAQCARCHNHKFDPMTMEDYYSLQSVFAAVDRANRPFETDPSVAARRAELLARREELSTREQELQAKVAQLAGPRLAEVDKLLAEGLKASRPEKRPEFGYHSRIEPKQDVAKWVQVDVGKPMLLKEVVIVGCHDDYNNIGAGFGFPMRFRIEVSNDPEFKEAATTVADRTGEDVPNPGVKPLSFPVPGEIPARYIRVTATKLAPRANDYIFALAELFAVTPDGTNVARGTEVSSLDSIEAPVRWGRKNLVDGIYYDTGERDVVEIERLKIEREQLLGKVDGSIRRQQEDVAASIRQTDRQLAALPPQPLVYAAATQFEKQGNSLPTLGKPREIRVLARGDVTKPGKLVTPGTLPIIPGASRRFNLSQSDPESPSPSGRGVGVREPGQEPEFRPSAIPSPPAPLPKGEGREESDSSDHSEGERRAALAKWLTRDDNPLTWRSIVNRVWLYHFGRGLVDSPNDFGRGGLLPSHPELLDWLAVEFRDGSSPPSPSGRAAGGEGESTKQSLKALHRLIVTSAVYRQSSAGNDDFERIDAENVYLWRMNRRRLTAEEIRDSVLGVAGKLDLAMGGPGYQDFVIEKPEHSPHYEYHLYDPDDAATHRRAIYRFIVRSQPQPMLDTLDCADPARSVPKRDETLTALQALAMMNNRFMVRMAERFAERLHREDASVEGCVTRGFRLVTGRDATPQERSDLAAYANEHGLANACRVLLNLNEFVFVD